MSLLGPYDTELAGHFPMLKFSTQCCMHLCSVFKGTLWLGFLFSVSNQTELCALFSTSENIWKALFAFFDVGESVLFTVIVNVILH